MQERISGAITYTASGTAIIGGLTLNDWAAIIGATVAVLSFIYSVWHKTQLRKIARGNARMADIEEADT